MRPSEKPSGAIAVGATGGVLVVGLVACAVPADAATAAPMLATVSSFRSNLFTSFA